MPSAEINGCTVNYELSGRANAPVVMLSHSLASDMALWDAQLEALEGRWRVLRYDTRGHGGSEATPGPYHLDLLGDDAVRLLDHLEIDHVHWVGISMGGMIGQNLALCHADRLRSAALCDTAARIPAEAKPAWEERIALARREGMAPLVEPTLARWFTDAYRARAPEPYRRIRQQILDTDVAGFTGCAAAIMELDYLDRLGEIDLPTLILVGDDDLSTPPPNSEAMHERIAGSELHVIADARHLTCVEQAEAFNSLLLAFLDRYC